VLPILSLAFVWLVQASAFAQIGGAITGESYEGRPMPKIATAEPVLGEINFEEDLYIEKDIMLQGALGYKRIDFTIPRYWEVLEGSRAEFYLSHSPTLIPDLSAFTAILNGKVIHTMALDRSNINVTTIVLNLPKNILSDYNVLELIANQHYTLECEDPFDPSLWTTIHRTSRILINHKKLVPYIDLAFYPYPIYEKQSYDDAVIDFMLPAQPSQTTLGAIARFQTAFGRFIPPRSKVKYNVGIGSSGEPVNHMILIGTPQENEAIRRFADLPTESALSLPLITEPGFSPKFTYPNGSKIEGDQGVIIFTHHPDNAEIAVLILSGNSAAGVDKAVTAITEIPYERSFAGQALVVEKVDPRPKLPEKTKSTHIPIDRDTFTLEDIKYEDTTVRGFFAPAVTIDILMEPDAHPAIGKQKFKLVYSYGAQLQAQLSSLEIILNGVSIDSKNLNVPEGESHAELLIDLPVDLLQPHNTLQVKFFLFPDNYFICGRVSDRHLWATVHKESELTMPRNYYVYLPDLKLMRYEWYPYTVYQDLGNTTFVLGDSASEADYAALLILAAQLGRITESEGIYVKAYQLSKLPEEVKSSDHLIVVDSSAHSALSRKLVGDTRLFYNDDNKRVMMTLENGEMKTVEWKSGGLIEQIVSPFNPEKTVLLVRGQDAKQLELAVVALSDNTKLTQLENNLAFSYDTDEVKSAQTVKPALIGELPTAEETQTWIYLNFWRTALLIIGFVILLYVAIMAIQYTRRRGKEKKHK